MKTYVEQGEVALMEQAASNLRDKLLIRILFHLGCRVTEALGLTLEDIDFTRGTVVIEHLKSRLKLSCPNCGAGISKGHTFCPKCGEKVVEAIGRTEAHGEHVLPQGVILHVAIASHNLLWELTSLWLSSAS